jgi:hypothetical protein
MEIFDCRSGQWYRRIFVFFPQFFHSNPGIAPWLSLDWFLLYPFQTIIGTSIIQPLKGTCIADSVAIAHKTRPQHSVPSPRSAHLFKAHYRYSSISDKRYEHSKRISNSSPREGPCPFPSLKLSSHCSYTPVSPTSHYHKGPEGIA